MATTAPAAPVRAALAQLIDYAGLFPPAQLDMAPALREYASARKGPYAWMLGRFIVPESRISELRQAAGEGVTVPLSVIVDAGNDARTWLSNVQAALGRLAQLTGTQSAVRVEALEIPLPPLATQRETYDAAIGQFAAARGQADCAAPAAYVELPRDARWAESLESAMFALARHGLGAKIRCGGVVPEAFPAPEDIAAFIHTAVEHGVPFKATAGLHHPVYHRDVGLDVMMHGFLNVLAATVAARAGASQSEIASIVACEDAAQLLPGTGTLTADALEGARRHAFAGYGSCSFEEPAADLEHLGVLRT